MMESVYLILVCLLLLWLEYAHHNGNLVPVCLLKRMTRWTLSMQQRLLSLSMFRKKLVSESAEVLYVLLTPLFVMVMLLILVLFLSISFFNLLLSLVPKVVYGVGLRLYTILSGILKPKIS